MTRQQRLSRLWRDKWFLSLKPLEKLLIEYIRAHCDACGVLEFNRTDVEMKLGFANIDPVWVHSGIRGIEFATKELAEEDAEARSLDDKKVRMKELPRWSSIIASINKLPQKYTGQLVPQIEVIGENLWWLVRFIENEYWPAAHGRHQSILKLHEPGNMRHRAALRALRRRGLYERFKQYYPDAVIVESPAEAKEDNAIAKAADPLSLGIPTMADVLAAPEGGRLPPQERRLFWMENHQTNWENIGDWKGHLRARELRWGIQFDYTQLTGNPWPETRQECSNALKSIETRLADENANRVEINGEKRLPEDARARVKILLKAKNMIETQLEK